MQRFVCYVVGPETTIEMRVCPKSSKGIVQK